MKGETPVRRERYPQDVAHDRMQRPTVNAMLSHLPTGSVMQDAARDQVAHEAACVRAVAKDRPDACGWRVNIHGGVRFAAVADAMGGDDRGATIVLRRCGR